MEYYERKYPNGTLILPEFIEDGEFEKITVEFEDLGQVFQVRKIEIFWSSCGAEMVQIFERLLTLPVEEVWENFVKCVRAIMITDDVYRFHFSEFTFSNSFISSLEDPFEFEIGGMKVRGVKKNRYYPEDYVLTYYDEVRERWIEQVLGHYNYVNYEALKKLKENPDKNFNENFERHVERITKMWESLMLNKRGMINKMGILGVFGHTKPLRKEEVDEIFDVWKG